MKDITERLRAYADGPFDAPESALVEAADEIDRLRADIASLMERHNNLHINAQRHRAEVESLRKDAERWRWGVKHAAWYRNEDRAHIAIPVAKDADLSCVAMRVAAIDAAMKP